MKFYIETRKGKFLASSMSVVGRYYEASDISEALEYPSIASATESFQLAVEWFEGEDGFPSKCTFIGREGSDYYRLAKFKAK